MSRVSLETMYTILMNVPNAIDATSFYRAIGPFGRLKRAIAGANLIFTDRYDWSVMSMCDVVFMQRPFTPQHKQIAQVAKDAGTPLWVDYDDDLFTVPVDNPAFQLYGAPDIRQSIAEICAMADHVTVSSPHLYRKMETLNPKMSVIPNAFDDRLMKWAAVDRKKPKEKLILWRGSNTHQKDLMSVASELIKHSHQFPEVTTNFVGYTPWFLIESMRHENTVITPALDVMNFFQFLQKIHPGIQIVPLHPNEFNKAKSNIAWIEGSYAGAACLVPDWEEWQRPGTIRYQDHKDFGAKLAGMCRGEFDLTRLAQESWDYIQSELTLDKVNRKRVEILKELVECTP